MEELKQEKKEKAEIQWTASQEKAIEARNCDLVVSAAAGSGKTAVLAQRIRALLEEGSVDASRLVVVTFTRAAAGELRERLYRTLSKEVAEHPENSALARQLFRLSRAQISTIHSFCYSLLKQYGKELNLKERLRVADPAESEALLFAAAEEAAEEFLSEPVAEEEAEARETLLLQFGKAGKESAVATTVMNLLKKTDSLPQGLKALWEKAEESKKEWALVKEGAAFGETETGRECAAGIVEYLEGVASVLDAFLRELEGCSYLSQCYRDGFCRRKNALSRAVLSLKQGNWEEALSCVAEFMEIPTDRVATKKCSPEELLLKEEMSDCLKKWKETIGKIQETELELSLEERLTEWEEQNAASERMLLLAQKAELRYQRKKEKKGILDYGDLEHLTLRLLAEKDGDSWKPSPLAATVAAQFDAVFVDEYQDSNRVQDLIFRFATRGNNLFIVGDPKQSIYRFRGADPSIFTRYKNSLEHYSPEKEGMQKILLSENFRCDQSVIRLVNRAFSQMMEGEKEGSLYSPEDHLRYSKKPEKEEGASAELILIPKGRTEEEGEEREAAYLASRIGDLLQGTEGRAYLPKEIAVLCRSSAEIAKVEAALEKRGIPSEGGSSSLKEKGEYLFVTSLLETVDNPARDIPLLGVLSSPVFCFSDDDLLSVRETLRGCSYYTALCRAAEGEGVVAGRCRDFLAELEFLRQESRENSLCSFLFTVYRRYFVEELYAGEEAGLRDWFLACAVSAEESGIRTLFEFCDYLSRQKGKTKERAGKGVQLMTFHGSKGLEFPVVFVSFLGKAFSRKDVEGPVILSPSGRLCVNSVRLGGRASWKHFLRRSAEREWKRENREEEKRILYVAMTRAENKLILTGSVRYEKSMKREVLATVSASLLPRERKALTDGASGLLEMLLISLREEETVRRLLRGETGEEEGFLAQWDDRISLECYEEPSNFEEELPSREFLSEALSFSYREEEMETLPKKLSVSEILKKNREDVAPEYFPRRLPDFQNGRLVTDAARIGEVTHRVMQFISLKKGKEDLEGELNRLRERGFLSEEEAEWVDRKALRAFFRSDLYEKMASSPKVEHEKRFNVLLPAKELLDKSGEVLVQGVVDLWFENPDGTLTLVDFKTDRVREADGEALLRERHGQQLRLYRRAVEEITDQRVSRLLIYSFALEREVEVEEKEGEDFSSLR